MLGIFPYVDDIVFLAEGEENLQTLLKFIHKQFLKLQMKTNESQTKIMDFRNTGKPRSRLRFRFGQSTLETVETYKYLGYFLINL